MSFLQHTLENFKSFQPEVKKCISECSNLVFIYLYLFKNLKEKKKHFWIDQEYIILYFVYLMFYYYLRVFAQFFDVLFSRLNYDANILYLIFARESEKWVFPVKIVIQLKALYWTWVHNCRFINLVNDRFPVLMNN